MFWHEYFAYQRGQSPQGMQRLWTLIQSKIPAAVLKQSKETGVDLEQAFTDTPKRLLEDFSGKLRWYAEKWICSPAGIKYKERVEYTRYNLTYRTRADTSL